MNDRDVGGMGEAEFKKWCNSVGLAANKFHEDKTGKDFLSSFHSMLTPSTSTKLRSPREFKSNRPTTGDASGKLRLPT